jgi:hypothetical protein
MMEMPQRELLLANNLVESFYQIVPTELSTYCSLTASIAKKVLLHFGVEADLLPCQIWLTTPEQNFVVGFTGKSSVPGKWNGHVVCSTANIIVDAALRNFTRDFDLTVPRIAAAHRFQVPTQVIARLNLNVQNGLWWHCPPDSDEIDLRIPNEPPELIAKYSAQLIEHMSAKVAVHCDGMVIDRPEISADSARLKMQD